MSERESERERDDYSHVRLVDVSIQYSRQSLPRYSRERERDRETERQRDREKGWRGG